MLFRPCLWANFIVFVNHDYFSKFVTIQKTGLQKFIHFYCFHSIFDRQIVPADEPAVYSLHKSDD